MVVFHDQFCDRTIATEHSGRFKVNDTSLAAFILPFRRRTPFSSISIANFRRRLLRVTALPSPCNTLAVLRSNRVQLENRLTFGTTCESLLTSVNVVHDLSSPSAVRFQQFPAAIRLRFAQEIGSVEPSVRFIKVGGGGSRVASSATFNFVGTHLNISPSCSSNWPGDERQRFERPWVGADPR
ncbi:hypothetical protein EVAR_57031_1 [Eumeta japonica]|uniref:Uncharacterized protein n=1 Tax=Eumeta variegata TaxID=151549 RepID=A0A4C2AFE8_EUMVA|nr:hypothetical protein EVAR_57031_1 [Eumeta japonica]